MILSLGQRLTAAIPTETSTAATVMVLIYPSSSPGQADPAFPLEVASDDEVLDTLAQEIRADLQGSGSVGFAVAYAGTAHVFITTLAREPTRRRCECIAIEAHDAGTHVRAYREIIRLPGRGPTLSALSAPEPATDSRYAALLPCASA
jgi:hypothetical protein